MQKPSFWQSLRQTIWYLFQPGILIYWFALSIFSTWVAIHHPHIFKEINSDNKSTLTIILIAQMALYIALYYKIFDSILLISRGERKKVPLAPNTISPANMGIRFLLAQTLVNYFVVYLLYPVSVLLVSLVTFFLFFISPAMIIIMAKTNQLKLVFSPQQWKKTIQHLGQNAYFAILFMPMLAALVAGVVFGVAFLMVMGGRVATQEEVIKYATVLQAFLEPYFVTLQMVFCGYFITTKANTGSALTSREIHLLSGAKTHQLSALEIKKFARNLVKAENFFQKNQLDGAIFLLEPYTKNETQAASYFPAWALLQKYYQASDNHAALESLQLKMIALAARGHDEFYQASLPALESIAANDLAQLPLATICPLAQWATSHQHYDLVLNLTRDFLTRFEGNQDAVEIGFYAAQALDKTGRRADSIALLKTVLEAYPHHPKIGRLQKAYEIMTQNQ